MKYRSEWKYICEGQDLQIIRNRVAALLPLDQNVGKEEYNIHSLYFDDYLNTCAFDNDAGNDERYKWRIRYYNEDRNLIKLEKKIKKNDRCYKIVSDLSLVQYDQIMRQDYSEVFWNTNDKLIQEFCTACLTKMLRPKIIVDYNRIAYVEPISDIRITFDLDISASLDTDRFIYNDYLKFPVQEKNRNVLEVKFDDVLPSYLASVLSDEALQRNTFSKYYLGRIVLERNLL